MLHKKRVFIRHFILIVGLIIPFEGSKAVEFNNLKKNIQQYVLSNNPYVRSIVKSNKNIQHFDYLVIGLHQSSCEEAMKTIGNYESYQRHLDFIKSSTYKNERINLRLSSIFMPFDMTLNFKIPRIRSSGVYPFSFDNGFLFGLEGKITVRQFKRHKKFKCLIGLEGSWSGKKTKIPDTIFEIFTKTIGQIGVSKLFRISGHRF